MQNKDLDLIGETVADLPYKLRIVDESGQVKHSYTGKASTNSIDIPQSVLGINSGSTGGNTGDNTGNTGNSNPSVGIDYYAGSLADGEITQRKLEWSGTDDPKAKTIITFNDDPGTKFFGQFDGITALGHIVGTAVNKGVIGNTYNIPLSYDPKNVVKAKYYTTVSPYPIYIKSASLPIGQKVELPINGIGEGLGNNVKAPKVYLTYNADKTMTIEHEEGYSNDGDSSGATGANYQFVFDRIAVFTTQAAVSQLPASVNLFSGSANGDVTLTGPTSFSENDMDGLLITFDQYATYKGSMYNRKYVESQNGPFRIDVSNLGYKTIKVPKEVLINGNSFPIDIPEYKGTADYWQNSGNSWIEATTGGSREPKLDIEGYASNLLTIKSGTVINFEMSLKFDAGLSNTAFDLSIAKISTYKN